MSAEKSGSVTLKLATSLDGRIATGAGESRWITGPEARAEVHRLRAAHDAVLAGIETVLADDPELTVRLEGHAGPRPARVVLDSRQRIPLTARLVRTARAVPTYVVCTGEPSQALMAAGVRVLRVKAVGDGRPELEAALEALKARGVTTVMVEGGGQVAASFLRCDLVDRIEWFRAPMLLGAEGRPGIGALAVNELAAAPRFRRTEVRPIGTDLWERYERA
jgi:diaminohydroxyphosphoribosylaminopyrimidine deaminase/5-amino-6-(5-phosphoribosylamino)uracil reductase